MTMLYLPTLIRDTAHAESLPVGTVAVMEREGVRTIASVRVRRGWLCTGEVTEDGEPAIIGHIAMVGDYALVPVEAEDEWGAELDHGNDHIFASPAQSKEQAEWQRDHNPHVATGRIMHQYRTRWTPVEDA